MVTRRRAPRRRSVWLDTLVNFTLTNANQASTDLMGSWDRDDARGLTVVRTIVELAITPQTPGAADGLQRVDIAIGMVTREAFLAGALPDPETPGDSPIQGWMWRTRCMVVSDTAGALTPTICRGDFRSARKLDESGNLFAVYYNSSIAGTTFTIQALGIIRQLHLLP